MFISAEYLKKMLDMRTNGYGTFIKNIVMFDLNEETEALKNRAINEFGIKVYLEFL